MSDTKLPPDKKEEISSLPPPPPAEAQALAGENPAGKPKPFITAGEKLHNEVTYRGIDFLLNSAIGVAFTYWTVKTKSGHQYFGKPVANFFKSILKPILKNEKNLEEGAKWGGLFTSIIIGGTAIIPPMMLAENRHVKREIIQGIDEKWYGKETIENDPKFAEAYERIEAEPRQGFWIGMAARLAVLAPMIAVTVIPKTNNFMIKYWYDPIAKGSKWLANTVGIKPGKMLTEGTMVHLEGDPNLPKKFQSNWDFLHTTVGFDLGLTFIYSFAHEIAYKALAALGMKETEDEPAPVKKAETLVEAKIAEESGKKIFAAQKTTRPAVAQRAAFTEYAQPLVPAERVL